nr:hypothetical protein [Tanacetum cinerariifolium]
MKIPNRLRDLICSLNSVDNENSVARDKTKGVNDTVSLDEEEIGMSNGMETMVELGKIEGNGNRDEQKVDEVMHAKSYDKNVCKDADETVKSIRCVAKTKPNKLPIWVKMCNVPLEAWTVKGISAYKNKNDVAYKNKNEIIRTKMI